MMRLRPREPLGVWLHRVGALRDQRSALAHPLKQRSVLRRIESVKTSGEHRQTDSSTVDCPAMNIRGDTPAPTGDNRDTALERHIG